MDPLSLALVPLSLLAVAGIVRAARGTSHPDEEREADEAYQYDHRHR